MRDFYPQDMRLRNWIMEQWRRVSLRNGFEEYDAPIVEYLDLLTAKSGQEIATQLFSLTDRGGRQLAIRPEITPSLARMVNAKINALPRPIKWFSMPRLCRAENTQRGRLREFFQWNLDVIGEDSELADAECIFTAVDFLREVGLTASDVVVRLGSRPLTAAIMRKIGLPAGGLEAALAVLDKRLKSTDEEFVRLARGLGLSDEQIAEVKRFQDCPTVAELRQIFADDADAQRSIDGIDRMLSFLRELGAADYCTLDLRIVRGLAYYTGIVYEIFDAAGSLRALAGGGRYDNLLEVLGGPKMGACGMGMGDPVLSILLTEKGKVPESLRQAGQDFFVMDDGEGMLERVLAAVGALRAKGYVADYSYKRQPLGKQLRDANRRGARVAVILRAGSAAVKNLQTGDQQELDLAAFLADPGPFLR